MTLVYLCETHSGMSTRWEQCGPEDMGATAFVEEGSGVSGGEAAFMDAVWDALKADASDLRKQQRILKAFRAALEPAPPDAPGDNGER